MVEVVKAFGERLIAHRSLVKVYHLGFDILLIGQQNCIRDGMEAFWTGYESCRFNVQRAFEESTEVMVMEFDLCFEWGIGWEKNKTGKQGMLSWLKIM